jgi:hypothetical protein
MKTQAVALAMKHVKHQSNLIAQKFKKEQKHQVSDKLQLLKSVRV